MIQSVVFRPQITFPLEWARTWNADTVDKMLALFADPLGSFIDFDNRYDLGDLGDNTQFDLTCEFDAMDIICRYEDQCYYRGEKYEEFAKEWEELKMRYNEA